LRLPSVYFCAATTFTFRRYDVTAGEGDRDMAKATEHRRKRFADNPTPDADKPAKLLRIPSRLVTLVLLAEPV
jgi:hypothetical protein